MLVEAEAGDHRVEVSQERIDRAQQRWELIAEELADSREAARGAVDDRFETFEEALCFRRQLREGDQGRREFFGNGDQLLHHRIGVEREALEAIEGEARLVLEGREGAE